MCRGLASNQESRALSAGLTWQRTFIVMLRRSALIAALACLVALGACATDEESLDTNALRGEAVEVLSGAYGYTVTGGTGAGAFSTTGSSFTAQGLASLTQTQGGQVAEARQQGPSSANKCEGVAR